MSSATRNLIRELAVKLARDCGVREWRFTRRDHDGRAYVAQKIIETGDPTNVNRLFVVAHECGHITLQRTPRRLPKHRSEYEAEQFAILLLRHFDVPVPHDMVEGGQDYVAWHVVMACLQWSLCLPADDAHEPRGKCKASDSTTARGN